MEGNFTRASMFQNNLATLQLVASLSPATRRALNVKKIRLTCSDINFFWVRNDGAIVPYSFTEIGNTLRCHSTVQFYWNRKCFMVQ